MNKHLLSRMQLSSSLRFIFGFLLWIGVAFTPTTATAQVVCPLVPITVPAPDDACESVVDYTLIVVPLTTVTLTSGFTTGSAFPVGTTEVCFEGDSFIFGINTCCFNVNVLDNTPPESVCLNPTLSLNINGQVAVMVADVFDVATDACGVQPGATLSSSAFFCDDIGPNDVTVQFADVNGNTGSCMSIVTVVDDIDPVALCQPLTVELDAAGNASITPAEVDNGSSDICGFVLSLDIMDFTCADVGTVDVTLTATDPSTNTGTCIATITVEDNEDPVLTNCTGTTVDANADCLFLGASAILATVNDNCNSSVLGIVVTDMDGAIVFNGATGALANGGYNITLNGAMIPLGVNDFIVTATDPSGNSGTCMASITVEDNTVPIAMCQDITVELDAAGAGVADPADVNNGSTDNCTADADLVLALDITDFTCANIGANPVVLTITDEAGNPTTCNQTVNVEDNIDPVMTDCVGATVDANADCLFLGAEAILATVNDNCNSSALGIVVTDMDGNVVVNAATGALANGGYLISLTGAMIPLGVNDFVVTATDASGNSGTCMASITVEDNTAPTPVCMDATVILDALGAGSITTADINNGSSDNCTADADLTLALDVTDFACANVGMNTVTLTVTDEAGNPATCTANVTVIDDTPPEALCQNAIVMLDVDGLGSITTADIDNGSNDVCGIASLALDRTDFTCADVPFSPITVTLTVTDNSGNISDCTAQVAVQDLVAPEVLCQNVTVELDDDGNGATTAAAVDNGSNDACGIAPNFPILSQLSFNCMNVGDVEVTLTVQDVNGNADQCTATVTVEDNVLPEALCQDVTVQLDDAGNGSTTAALVDNGSNDACGIESLELDITDFTCDNVGVNDVILTVTDENGNISTCPATVTVEDNVLPIALCQGITVQLDADGNGIADPALVDNGSSDACGIASLVLNITAFTCNNVGVINPVILTVTDNNGNSALCSAPVIVEDNVAPEALCMDAVVLLDNDGNGSIDTGDIDNGSNDACGIASLSLNITEFDCSSVGANGTVLTVVDVNGNVSTCSAVVTVQDLIPAVIQCRQPVSTVNTPGVCGRNDLTVLEPFSLYDNCGAENVIFTRIPAGNDFSIGETELNWTATDANGNESYCQSLVIIQDSEFPTIASCNAEIDYVEPGSCFAQVVVEAATFDNCGVASVTGTGTFTLPFGAYDNPITVTDVNGNVTVHEFTIFVHDVLEPVFGNCPEETVLLQAGVDGTASYPAQTPVATDNCGVPTITNDLPEDGFPMGSSVVTFTAEDAYGNTTDCVVNVEVSGGIFMHPSSDIESSLAEDETTQDVTWNSLNAGTICELCEETALEGFKYVGTWWGHQYFLANEASLTRDEASLIAEGYDAHLAVINDAAENAYLTEALDEEIRSAWIGLLPQLQDEEWTFAWDNGDAFDFDVSAFDVITAETRIILSNDGTWKEATITEDKYFLLERPCVTFEQTGPIYVQEVEEGEDEIPGVLLRSGDAWPEGEYEVTYALIDMCGNEAVMNFGVDVLSEVAEYCSTAGTDNSVWVEEFVFHDLISESENNDGYADFTEETMTMNIGDGVVLLRMAAGGNEAEDMLYWNVYLDADSDGDFFDAGEMLYQVASREAIEANLTLPVVSLENVRLRVMVSRYAFAAPCGNTYVGEIEDYNLNLLIPEDYARAACDVQVAGLNGVRAGMSVDLDWTVNSACPIDSYTVEYSVDGQNFMAVTQIAESDFADVVYTGNYTTTFPTTENGTILYRVSVQPADQPAFYTNTVDFRLNNKPNAPILYPNPADNYVSIALSGHAGANGTVVIYDNLGKVRLTQRFDATTGDNMTLNLQKFTDGIYHVSVESEGLRKQTQRLVIGKLYGWKPAK